jgi:hypothetical protein
MAVAQLQQYYVVAQAYGCRDAGAGGGGAVEGGDCGRDEVGVRADDEACDCRQRASLSAGSRSGGRSNWEPEVWKSSWVGGC